MAETMEAMGPVAASLGVDMAVQTGANGRPVAPVLNVLRPILEVCHEVAMILRGENVYLLSDRVVTIEPDGEVRDLDRERFVSFLPKFCVVSKGKDEDGAPRRIDLAAKRAGEILASDALRNMLPRVTRILSARLPVYTADRKGVRLLAPGYDSEHEVFVTRDAPAVESWYIDDAVGFLRSLYATFPWGDSGRSKAAQLAAQVGLFTQLLFPDAIAVPLFFWNANLEGSGKSILAEMAITAICGDAVSVGLSDGEEFEKVLATKAFAFASYLFLDDVEGFIKSQSLNRWVVQTQWGARQMGTHRERSVPKRCMTLITGNRATLSDDLVRRMVLVDLFSSQSASERQAQREKAGGTEITSPWLQRPENRQKLLSALWGLVSFWAEQGMPPAPRRMASFVEWTDVVGGIVFNAGFGDPFAPAQLSDAGDKWQVEWRRVFAEVVRRFLIQPGKDEAVVSLDEFCAAAREMGFYQEKIGSLAEARMHLEQNPKFWKLPTEGEFTEGMKQAQALRWMHPQKQASPFSKLLCKRGGQITEVDGRQFEFAHRDVRGAPFKIRAV